MYHLSICRDLNCVTYKSDIKYKREDKMSLGWVVYSLTIVNVKTYTLGQWVLCTECVARWLVVSKL